MPKKELTLHEKLVDIQSRLKVPKSLKNNFGKYNYRSNELILEAVKPLLREHDLVLTQQDEMIEVGGRVYCKSRSTLINTLTDQKEYEEDPMFSVEAFAQEDQEQKGMVAPMRTGSASSYARKYSLNGLFLLDDSKDCDTDEHHTEAKSKATDHDTKWKAHIDKVIKACLNEEDVAKALITLNSLQGANLYKNYIENKANEKINFIHGGK